MADPGSFTLREYKGENARLKGEIKALKEAREKMIDSLSAFFDSDCMQLLAKLEKAYKQLLEPSR